MRHEGFAENQQLFFPDFALWEQFDHLMMAEQSDFLYLLPGGSPRLRLFEVPQVKIAGQEDPDYFRKELKARENPVRFYREPEIRGLNEMVS